MEKTCDNICSYAKDTREMHNKLESRLEGNLERLWLAVDKMNETLTSRLPIWATVVLSFMTAVIGAMGAAWIGRI